MSADKTLLDQIKDQVAKEYYKSDGYEDLLKRGSKEFIDSIVDIIAERYATAKAQASCEELNTVLKRLGKDLMLVVCDDGSFDLINPSKFPSL